MSGLDANVVPVAPTGRRRSGMSIAFRAGVLICFAMAAGNASATALEGVATALRLLTPLVLLVLLKGRQAPTSVANLLTLGAIAALILGVAFLWRSRATVRRWVRWPLRWRRTASSFSPFGDVLAALPAHVDRQRLHGELRQHFLKLQLAWDQSECSALAQLTTPTMLDELCAARAAKAGLSQRTEVLNLDLQVLAFEAVGATEVACVEFCGTLRECGPTAEAPFRELWMLTREPDATGSAPWRLARHQALL